MKTVLPLAVALALALTGCFDSFVTGHCLPGYIACGDTCVAAETCALDAGPGTDADAPVTPDAPGAPDAAAIPDAAASPDARICTGGEEVCRDTCIDPTSDPDNCGGCGMFCTSGICSEGVCAGGPVGHVVVIGHDFVVNRTGMNRLVGNAVFLARVPRVNVVSYGDGAMPFTVDHTNAAIDQVASEIGRTWSRVAATAASVPARLASADVFLVYAQNASTGLDDLAAAWSDALATFLGRGGVVIVLEGTAGETHRLLGDRFVSASRVVTTGQTLVVNAARDAVAAAVPSSYWAEADSVAFTGTTAAAVVVDASGDAVVLHQTFE